MNISAFNIPAIAAVVSSALAVGAANANYTKIDPIIHTFDVMGQATTITVHPGISINGKPGRFHLDLKATLDAADLQRQLSNVASKHWKNEECGERLRTFSPVVSPTGDGRLFVGLSAQVQQWKCTYADVPEMKHEDIKIFGRKVGSMHVPTGRWVTKRTMKTKLLSQSFRVEAVVSPVLNGDTITASVAVTRARLSSLAGKIIDAFGLKGKVKQIVQKKVNNALQGKRYTVPEEAAQYNVKVRKLKFLDLGNGKLGLGVEASGEISQEQIATLVNDRVKRN